MSQSKRRWYSLALNSLMVAAFLPAAIALGEPAGSAPPAAPGPEGTVVQTVGGKTPVQAASPFTDYTGRAVLQVLLIGALVLTLLGGAFLVLNLGLLSKRREDRVGGRDPSDVAVLKNGIYPVDADGGSTPGVADLAEGLLRRGNDQHSDHKEENVGVQLEEVVQNGAAKPGKSRRAV